MLFNSLKYAKQLEGAGLNRVQAETYIEIMGDIIESNLATSQDLKDLTGTLTGQMKDIETNLTHDMKSLETKLTNEMNNLETNLTHDMKSLETKLTNEMNNLETKMTQQMKDLRTDLSDEMIKSEERLTKKITYFASEADRANANAENEFRLVRSEFSQECTLLRREIADVENRLTIKLGTIVSIAVGIAVTLAKVV